MGFSHAIGGTAAWFAVTALIPTEPVLGVQAPTLAPAALLAGAMVSAGAALLPDADHKSATISRTVPVLGPVVTSAIGGVAGGHRAGAHSLLAAVLVTGAAVGLGFWRADVPVLGEISLGPALATVALIAFAAKARDLVSPTSAAWLVGLLAALVVIVAAPDTTVWFPLAVGLGFLAHIVGDALTYGGVPGPLWPAVVRPPRKWSRTPVLRALWKRNGHIALPLVGATGSIREWVVAVALGVYCVYGIGQALLALGAEYLPFLQI